MDCKKQWLDSGYRLAYGPGDATATHCLVSVNLDWFYLSHTGTPGQSRTEGRLTGVGVVLNHHTN